MVWLLPAGASICGTAIRRWSFERRIASALSTVRSNFASDTGFSMKSTAPSRVASTAVSTVPWPDIITTAPGEPFSDHSFSSEMPSVSGIQMSRRIRSYSRSLRATLAAAASAAVVTS